MTLMIDEKRMRWRCRRGMKELDVMLERFLASGYGCLSESERRTFSRLLDARDPDLYGWLSGAERPADQDLARVVSIVRHHVAGRA